MRFWGGLLLIVFEVGSVSATAGTLLSVPRPTLSRAVSDSTVKLEKLFGHLLKIGSPAAHTFVFFVQGAADHYVPESLDDLNGKWGNADAADVKKIVALARQCRECNVVLLHIQRGGARWYTAKHPWATYVRVFSRGKKFLSKHVDVINGADPDVLTRLLAASQEWFPESKIHLIYRGHGFFPDYDPKRVTGVGPFDANFPESPYGVGIFASSIAQADLGDHLGSISLAACEMKRPEVLAELSMLSSVLIATPYPVDETLSRGFNYTFLPLIRDTDSEKTVGEKIEHLLFSRAVEG